MHDRLSPRWILHIFFLMSNYRWRCMPQIVLSPLLTTDCSESVFEKPFPAFAVSIFDFGQSALTGETWLYFSRFLATAGFLCMYTFTLDEK